VAGWVRKGGGGGPLRCHSPCLLSSGQARPVIRAPVLGPLAPARGRRRVRFILCDKPHHEDLQHLRIWVTVLQAGTRFLPIGLMLDWCKTRKDTDRLWMGGRIVGVMLVWRRIEYGGWLDIACRLRQLGMIILPFILEPMPQTLTMAYSACPDARRDTTPPPFHSPLTQAHR